ncbi:hypothetical protein [Alteromonas sp.]|uniref:hypothetical protein n=1 Tax=Alteromonas sp. TaxID=232 RepID=UPI00257E56C5|nr:hypothetical protein [Alteromonas sp.]NQY19682.1 hypothetical protein [Alteromonas sp.]
MEKSIETKYEEEFGVVAYCEDSDLADKFDDFLTESLYVFYEMKFLENKTEYYFGKASCQEAVNKIIDSFLAKNLI